MTGEQHNTQGSLQKRAFEDVLKRAVVSLEIPESFEKSVASLCAYVSIRLLDRNLKTIIDSANNTRNIETEIKKELEYITTLSSNEQKLVSRLTDLIRAESWGDAEREANIVMREVRPFNIRETLELISLTDSMVDSVRGKNIALFMGKTGVGKSTTIHFLAGSKMRKTKMDGINHIEATDIPSEELKKITSTPFSKSETRYVTTASVEVDSSTLVLTDSPGFGDTSGAEVDVACTVGIVKAVKECNSVRPIIQFSKRGIGDRMELLQDVIQVIIGMIPNISDYMRSLSYIYTNFESGEEKEISEKLQSAINRNLAKNDEIFEMFLIDMHTKAFGKKRKSVMCPLEDDREEWLEQIYKVSPIENCVDVFQTSFTQKSQISLHSQANKSREHVAKAIERCEYEYVAYKIDELRQLNECISQDYLHKSIEQCCHLVKQRLTFLFETSVKRLQDIIRGNSIQDHVGEILATLEELQVAESSRATTENYSSSLLENITEQCNTIFNNLQQEELSSRSFRVGIENLKLMAQHFEHVKHLHTKVQEMIKSKLSKIGMVAKEALSKNQFDEYANSLLNVKESCATLGEDDTMYKDLVSMFKTQIGERMIKEIVPLLETPSRHHKELQNIDELVNNMFQSVLLRQHISMQTISHIRDDLSSLVEQTHKKFIDDISKTFERQVWSLAFKNVQSVIKEASVLAELHNLGTKLTMSHSKAITMLKEKLVIAQQECENKLAELRDPTNFDDETMESLSKIDLNKLGMQVGVIKNAHWIETYSPGAYSNVINEIESTIQSYTLDVKNIIPHLDSRNTNRLVTTIKIMNQFQRPQFLSLVSDMSHVKEATTELTNTFKNRVLQHFGQFEGYLSEFNATKIENALKYIGICARSHVLQEETEAIRTKFETYIEQYTNTTRESAMSSFHEIIEQPNSKAATTLYTCLQMLRDLKNSATLCEIGSPGYDIVLKAINTQYKSMMLLMQELADASDLEPLAVQITIAKCLSVIDEHVNNSFLALYSQHNQALQQVIMNDVQAATEYISVGNYTQLGNILKELNKNPSAVHHVNRIKKTLQASVNHCQEEVITKIQYLNSSNLVQDITDILKQLQSLTQVTKHVGTFLHEQVQFASIEKLLGEKINRYLQQVSTLIQNSEYQEANTCEAQLENLFPIMKPYLSESTAEEITSLKKRIEQSLLDVCDMYSTMDLEKFWWNPPNQTIEKLKKYPHITEQIEKTIVARFRIELKTIVETSTTPEKQLVMIENLVKDTYPSSVQRVLCNMIPTALDTYVNDLYRQLMENVHCLDGNNMQDCIKNFKRLKQLCQGGSANVQIIPIEEAIVQKVVQYTTNATANQQLETMLNELVSNLTVSTEEIQKVKNRLEETKLEQISTIVTMAKEFIDASNFEQVAKCLLELKQVSSNHFSSVQQLVQTRLDEVYNQTLFKANHLDVSDVSGIEKIKESLEWISNASVHIGGLMYESVQVERIVEQKTKDYIHATLGLIHAGQYDQVSTRQSHLNTIIKLVNVSTLTVDQVNQLSGELDSSVKGIAQKYENIPLEEYSSIPPIEMIAKLKTSNPSVAQDIETVISLRFKTEMKSIDTSEKATDLIISLNVLLSLYPTHLRDTLRTELQVIAHQHVNKIESRLIKILEQSWITAQEFQLFNKLYNQRESLKKVDLLKDYRYEPLRKRFKGYTDALVKQGTEKKHFENVVENLRLVKDKIPDFSSLAAQEINKLEKQFK